MGLGVALRSQAYSFILGWALPPLEPQGSSAQLAKASGLEAPLFSA